MWLYKINKMAKLLQKWVVLAYINMLVAIKKITIIYKTIDN